MGWESFTEVEITDWNKDTSEELVKIEKSILPQAFLGEIPAKRIKVERHGEVNRLKIRLSAKEIPSRLKRIPIAASTKDWGLDKWVRCYDLILPDGTDILMQPITTLEKLDIKYDRMGKVKSIYIQMLVQFDD